MRYVRWEVGRLKPNLTSCGGHAWYPSRREKLRKVFALPYSDEDFEKLEERFRSLLQMTVLEMKEALEEAKRNYREALKCHMNKE